jgi:hypothetical protein
MVTSSPYNVKKEYDENLTLDDYIKLLWRVLKGLLIYSLTIRSWFYI